MPSWPTPRFPIYIPSKGRADTALTPLLLDELHVPYRIIVEAHEQDKYALRWGAHRIIVLDPKYQETYETCDEFGTTKSVGSGAARNFAWDHSIKEGAKWHWVMDDNIRRFLRYTQNTRHLVGDGEIFVAMEDFVTRYRNIAMAGPEYRMFLPARSKRPPFRMNTRIFSCMLINNEVKERWRGRFNEDLILSIDMLKAGWCTVLFNAFLQDKITTQTMSGGNTEMYKREGTRVKSEMALRVHPDIVKEVVVRYGRWHHHADFSAFEKRRLILRDDYVPPQQNPYRPAELVRNPAPPRKPVRRVGK